LFFISERIGKDNKPFKLYKFRSMTDLKNEDIDVASKNEYSRVTKFGEFIRKTRIDELPQLINVVKGEVSLIGPRPELPKLVIEYSNQIPFYGIRHTITPGLSGYAQIYQDPKSVPKFGLATDGTKLKLSYDVYYLKHRSILLDLSLMIKTVKTLIGKTGL
jgi:lipopolysaccharide/colanic/teichoic acid biosynthesis glycosyltransferase